MTDVRTEPDSGTVDAPACTAAQVAHAIRFLQTTRTARLAGWLVLAVVPPVAAVCLATAPDALEWLVIPAGIGVLGLVSLLTRSRAAVWVWSVPWAVVTLAMALPILWFFGGLLKGIVAWSATPIVSLLALLTWCIASFWLKSVRPLLLWPGREALRLAEHLVARARGTKAEDEAVVGLQACRAGLYRAWQACVCEGVAVFTCCSDRDVWAATVGDVHVRELRTRRTGETEVLLSMPGRELRCRMTPETLAKLRAWQASDGSDAGDDNEARGNDGS